MSYNLSLPWAKEKHKNGEEKQTPTTTIYLPFILCKLRWALLM